MKTFMLVAEEPIESNVYLEFCKFINVIICGFDDRFKNT